MEYPQYPLPCFDCFDKHKKRIFIIMIYGLLTQCMNLSILGPFFPIKAKQFDISDAMIGLIFSGAPLGTIICSFFIRSKMSGNRKNYMMAGVMFYILGMVGFGLIFYTEDRIFIIVGAVVCRFIMGVGMSMYDTPALSIIPLLYKNIHTKLGIIEFAQNIGFLIGPLLGTILFNQGSYEMPFFVMAAIQSLTLPLLIFLIPTSAQIAEYIKVNSFISKQLNFEEEDYERDQMTFSNLQTQLIYQEQKSVYNKSTNMVEENQQHPSFRTAICHYKIFLIFMMIFLTADGFLFLDSSYATYLEVRFSLSQNQINYLFVASYSCSALSSFLVSLIAERRSRNLNIMLIGFVIIFISYLFIGPAPFLQIKTNIILTSVSRCIIACCQQMVYIPAIKELYSILKLIFYKTQDYSSISNMSSTIFIISLQLGELVGPIIGGILTQMLGFQQSSSILSIFSIGILIVVTLFKTVFKDENKQNQHNLQVEKRKLEKQKIIE